MQPIWLNGKKYYAEAARPSSGIHPHTCSAFIKTSEGMMPVKTQAKLYCLALILKGEVKNGEARDKSTKKAQSR